MTPRPSFWHPHVYAGDGLFSEEEDTYNPARDAPRVVGEWIAAGGEMQCEPRVAMKYVFFADVPRA